MQVDIFFIITSVAVILVTILLVVVLSYVLKILHDFTHISSKVREESDEIIKDVTHARETIKKESVKVGDMIGYMKGLFIKKHKSKKIK